MCVLAMSDAFSRRTLAKSVLVVLTFLLASWSPMLALPTEISLLEEADNTPQKSSMYTATSGYGHDFAGTTLTFDGMVNAVVKEESMFDYWHSQELNNSTIENHGTPDLKLTRHDREHYCWSTEEGPVRTAVHRPSGAWTSSLVDTVASSNSSTLVDCAIGITANELPRVLYADGPDLKMGRYARESATYYDGPRWHTRTIMENVNATHLALDITSEGLEWGLMRTDSGALHQVNFSGAYWTSYLLDRGPVGEDFELEIDDQGVIHILYTRSSLGEVILLRIDGTEHDLRILATDNTIVDGVGMDLDDQNIEQVATMTQSGNAFSINLIRSLAGQDSGRVNPTPTQIVTGQDDVSEGAIKVADLNSDGFDDLIIATPQASLLTYVENGRVDIYYGSSSGVADIPDMILAGESNGSHFGTGLDTGDFNHDGIQDLAVGLPGWNPTNDSNLTHGQVHVYLGNSTGISAMPWWSVSGSNGERLGSYLAALVHDGQADMLAASANGHVIDSGTSTIYGKVNVYDGGEFSLSSQRNLTASKNGNMFGRSIEGCDMNGDGREELIISNVGTYTTTPDYSSVEYFSGMATGYNGTPDHTLETNKQGRLFGHTVACVGDVQGDGFADHIITEPFNGTETFGGGKLWMYNGGDSGYQNGPNWTLVPSVLNSRIGEAIVSAGDINEDGYGDVYISSLNGDESGKVEIYLGSASGLQSEAQLLAQGTSNQKIGQGMAAMGDLNGDGLGEMIFSSRNSQQGANYGLEYHILSERDWESLSFVYTGTAQGLDLATAHRGETSIVFTYTDNTGMHLEKLEHMKDQTPSGQWVHQSLTEDANVNTTFIFKARSTGQPIIITQDENAINLHTTRSMTAVQENVASTGTVGQYLGSTIDQYGKQAVAYTTGAGQQIFYSAYDETNGWTSEMVRNSVTLGGNISVQVNSTDVPHLIYRHGDTNQLALATRDSSWTLSTLGEEGEALSSQHPTMLVANDDLVVALVTQDDGVSESNLSLWTYDGISLSKSTIANGTDSDVQIDMAQLTNGSILVAVLTDDGTLSVYEQWPGDDNWSQHTITQPSGIAGEFRLDLEGGASPILAVRGNAVSSLMAMNNTGHWVAIQERPAAAVHGAWDVLHTGTHLLMLTSDPITQHLIVNTAELNGVHSGFAPWMSVQFGDVVVSEELNAMIDANGTVHMAYWDTVNDDVMILRLYEDQDRDLVFDLMDAMPAVGDQWMNTDGDNHGDNPLGPLPDACPTTNGPSSYIIFGCEDYDTDGYKDSIDGCDDVGGTSWIDRYGCGDLDQDGWSDNDATYYDGDQFKGNWKQALDTDGDGFGDNHGVDCCQTPLDPNANSGDLFPYLASQYADFDGDGYGDNDTDMFNGDFCPWDYGVSWRDRNGCLDSDSDGSSDPSDEGSIFEWNITHGADVWPFDSTQWVDSDGDGYGDNDSENATNPDHFKFYPAAANDTDGDGFPDNWTALYNGSNGMGLKLDGCSDIWGNSTRPVVGCLDSDGDGYTNIYSYDLNTSSGLRENQQGDAFPDLDSQWSDTDGDGFGDQLAGVEGDECPNEAGVFNGTNGIGCRIIDVADSDGDGVINDLDTLCPTTPAGEPVNADGCAQSELDDDNDGVTNNLDLCASTPTGISVDAEGCSLEQRTSDTDGDGVNDPEDNCPATPSGETVDTKGCAESQRDSDGDGLSDLDDACDDTPAGFPILDNGCTDENALDTDLDGDGFYGMYTYDVDPTTGLHTNQTGDAFPSDPTQWYDSDGDGYGDNPSPAFNADDCPNEAGTSFKDFLGCYDDGDGWRDEDEPASTRDDPTQWRDTDFDGFGDNWGEASWNATREAYYERLNLNDPGLFIDGAANSDRCPNTPFGLSNSVDEFGCHISERDTDGDGVLDDSDNCVDQPKGVDGYDDGCPYVPQSGDGDDDLFGLDAGALMIILGVSGLGLVIVGLIIARMLREDDDDEDDDDYFYDDDEEEEERVLDVLDRKGVSPMASRPRQASQPSAKPAQKAAPRTPPGRQKSSGPPGRQPPAREPPSRKAPPAQKVAKKKSVPSEDASSTKVRKARIQVDLNIFEDWQEDDRESAVEWVVGAISEGEDERSVLMQLQETGWSAEQSRAICNLAKNRSA